MAINEALNSWPSMNLYKKLMEIRVNSWTFVLKKIKRACAFEKTLLCISASVERYSNS